MKKLLLLLLCLPMLTLAQQTYVPDDQFEQELINLGYDNVLDDYVMTASIDTVTSLTLDWSSCISDATGIEDFVSLTILQILCNNLVDLDLSQNINLTSFWMDSTWSLQTLNLKNGNNLNMTINIWGAWNLGCVNVDDVVWANNNWASLINASPNAFFSEDCYIGRMEGYVYFDTDSSTTFDVSEAGLQNQVLELVDGNGVTQYVNTDNTGFFSSPVDSALSFTLSYYPLSNFYETSNNVSHTFQNIAYDSVLMALNFGVLSDTSYIDVSLSITKSFTLCNDTATIWIDVTNHGGTDIDGSFEVWVDNQTPITATSGSPVITNNHIEWSFTGLQSLQHIQQTINVVIPASPGVILIDSARVTPIISPPLYEFNTFNNFDEISNTVFCSMDPNDKKVQPEQCYYKSDEVMDYTIRFQNTGNYPAQKVRIIDTLDYNVLDVLSFQVVGASHDYTWQFKGSSVLEVIFDNIQLVDSSVSYVESQGFFKYQIKFKDNITALSESEMPAYIYFDNNQPVITNKPLAVYSETFNAIIITQAPYNLEAQIIDGASPFTYLWSTNDSTQNINIQSTGTHWAIITDANGCELDTLMYNVTAVAGCPDPLACNYDPLATIDDSSCVYSVIWQQSFWICTGDSIVVGNNVYYNVGIYTDILQTINGCDSIVYTSISISSPVFITVINSSYNGYNISCFGGTDGWIEINIPGGSPPFMYNWSNGQSTALATNLSAGSYSVDIIDVTNCLTQYTFVLTEPTPLSISINATDETAALNDGSANAIVLGGILPYSYNWSNGSTTNPSLNLAPGLYTVDVIDANGCIVSTSVSVNAYIPTNIIDIENASKNLSKITDMLGRETPQRRNTPLFYIYDDGTVEKRIVIE